MKIKKLIFSVMTFIALANISSAQQVYVNRVFQDNTGNPSFNPLLNLFGGQWSSSILTGTGELLTVGYSSVSGQGQNIYLVKYDPDGNILFQTYYNSGSSNNDYGTGIVEASNGDILVCGTTNNGGTTDYDIVVLRISSTGSVLSSATRDGGINKNDIAVAVLEDSGGNVIVAANKEGIFGMFDYWVLKYSSSLNYINDNIYDYTGLQDIALGLQFSGADICLIGASASGTASCDYALAKFDGSSLAYLSDSRNNLPGTTLDQATAFCKDASNNTFITGKAWNGTDFDIKTVKISSTFSVAWTATLDVNGLEDGGTTISVDAGGNVIVGGYVTNSNSKKDLICIKYNGSSGSLIWQQTQTSEDPIGDSYIKKVAVNPVNSNVYFVAGEKSAGGNKHTLIGRINSNGTRSWQKTIKEAGNDILPSDLKVASDGIYVISVKDSTNDSYLITKYEELDMDTIIVSDSIGNPAWKQNELIVRFLSSVTNSAEINNSVGSKISEFGDLSDFIDSTAYSILTSAIAEYCRDCQIKAVKVFGGMPTTFTSTTNRLGETIPIPDFWATFVLIFPNSANLKQIHNAFKSIPNVVAYSHPNFLLKLGSGPNDLLYSGQGSLHSTTTYPNGHINLEDAWGIIPSGGLPFVRGGVFDTGITWSHQDFGYNGVAASTSKIKGGWDFQTNQALLTIPVGNDSFDHGTPCAGIIGGVRNNQLGIAGISGGNDSIGNKGVSLYGLKLMSPAVFAQTLNYVANAMVNTTHSNTTMSPYAYALNFMNHSWYISPTNPSSSIWYTDTNITILTEASHFVNRANVTMVVCRGNEGLNSPTLPATIDDDWMLSVGGTGTDGTFGHDSNWIISTPNNCEFTPSYGRNIDIAAPCTNSLIYTTGANGGYRSFNGTSAAAPHVSGAVGLLMSYMNNPNGNADYNNLAPEDCEEILQMSATDVNSTGYDVLTGFGRLNVGNALRKIQKPFYTLHHFGSNANTSHIVLRTLESSNDTVQLTERYRNSNFSWFQKGKYIVSKTYRIDGVMSHNLASTDTIKASWPRSSSSGIWAKFNSQKKLEPRERVKIILCNNGAAWLRGYIFQMKDSLGNSIGWWPCDTTNAGITGSLFEYSVLTRNYASTVGMKSESKLNENVLVFPNPSNNFQTIQIHTEKVSTLSIEMYDLMGRLVKIVFNGKTNVGNTEVMNDVSTLNNSMYIYLIKVDDDIVSKRFVKQ